MRKAVLVSGSGFIAWGLWQLLPALRIISFYREVEVATPWMAILLPLVALGYGTAQIVCYLKNFKNKKIYSVLFFLSLAVIILWGGYILIGGWFANQRIERILNPS